MRQLDEVRETFQGVQVSAKVFKAGLSKLRPKKDQANL